MKNAGARYDTSASDYARATKRAARRHQTNKRHRNAAEATAFRQKSAARFRFIVGALFSIVPIALLYINGTRGDILIVYALGLMLLCGWAYRTRNVVDD